jgi:high affinity sulfate transporter 1
LKVEMTLSPLLSSLRRYQRSWLRPDLIAGLTVVALLIPEGMAYAKLAGVPPQTAFYAAPVVLLIYALSGTSRQLVVAVSSAIAVLSAATVGPLAEAGTPKFVALTAALALMTGLVSAVAGFLRLGRINQFFSSSVLTGFVFGLALIIAVKQVPKVFGLEAPDGEFFPRVWWILTHLGETHVPTLIVGVAAVLLQIFFEARLRRVPGPLVVLLLGILAASVFGLGQRDVKLVGHIEGGLVPPKLPDVGFADVVRLIAGACGMALVVFAEAIGPARVFAGKHGYSVRPNRELIGLGLSNLGAGLFQGFPIGASLSKSAANDEAGARTQVSSIFAALLMVPVALFLTAVFRSLPEATLAAIVIVAVSHMMHPKELLRLARLRRADFAGAAVALVGVLALGILKGLFLAVVLSIFLTVARATAPRISELGRRRGTLGFVNRQHEGSAVLVPGLLVLRPNQGIFFGNATALQDEIVRRTRVPDPPVEAVLLDLAHTSDLDIPGADMLGELYDALDARGVKLILAGVSSNVREILERTHIVEKLGEDHVHRVILAGLEDFLLNEHPHSREQWDVIRDGLSRIDQIVEEVEPHTEGEERRSVERLRERLAEASRDLHALH